jgi:hypothetical protein
MDKLDRDAEFVCTLSKTVLEACFAALAQAPVNNSFAMQPAAFMTCQPLRER